MFLSVHVRVSDPTLAANLDQAIQEFGWRLAPVDDALLDAVVTDDRAMVDSQAPCFVLGPPGPKSADTIDGLIALMRRTLRPRLGEIELSGRRINLDDGRIPSQNSKLSQRELELLRVLVRFGDRVVPKDELLYRVWGGGKGDALYQTVKRLRKKIEPDPNQPQHLLKVQGVGYTLAFRSSQAIEPASPPPPPPLFGRTEQIADVLGLLERRQVVTLVGPGGVGKTSIALVVASQRQDRTVFVELATAQTGGDVETLLARQLGISLRGANNPAQLRAALHVGGVGLVVLDNCEQLEPQALGDLPAWLGDDASALLTSRESLGVAKEQTVAVDVLGPEAAAQLFVDAGERANPGAVLDPKQVGEVVALLEGLPLAIELAAPHLRQWDLATLIERLAQPLSVLRLRRGPVDRHRTMRAAIAWSWDLLHEPEQALLAALSTFVFPVSPADVEAVVEGLREHLPDLAVQSLVQLSGHQVRMFETIRAFALEKLLEEPDTHHHWHLAHANHFAKLGHNPQRLLFQGWDPTPWKESITNIQHALRSEAAATHHGHLALAAALLAEVEGPLHQTAVALERHWQQFDGDEAAWVTSQLAILYWAAGDLEKAGGWASIALSMPVKDSNTRFRCLWAGCLDGTLSQDEAHQLHVEALEASAPSLLRAWALVMVGGCPRCNAPSALEATIMFRDLNHPAGEATASLQHGFALLRQGDPIGAEVYFRRGIEMGTPLIVSNCKQGLALCWQDSPRAVPLLEEVRSEYEAHGYVARLPGLVMNIGAIHKRGGRYQEAMQVGQEAIALADQHAPWLRPSTRKFVAEAAVHLGKHDTAHRLLDEALTDTIEVQNLNEEASIRTYLAWALVHTEDLGGARAQLNQVFEGWSAIQYGGYRAQAQAVRGLLALANGEQTLARECLAAARKEVDDPATIPWIAMLEGQLSEPRGSPV